MAEPAISMTATTSFLPLPLPLPSPPPAVGAAMPS